MKEKIDSIINNQKHYVSQEKAQTLYNNKYNKQAIDFLFETKTKCDIIYMAKSTPQWDNKDHDMYSVTLKNKKHSYTFNFYDSTFNTEARSNGKGELLTFDFYSILASLSSFVPENFDEYCSYFGVEFKNETEYIKHKKSHLDILDQQKQLRKLFTEEELEKLWEIQ